MFRSKIFDILCELSKDELKKFGDFLSSPVFNKRKILYELFRVYKYYHPDFDNPNLRKDKVFRKLYKSTEYNDEIFRNLNSQLIKQAENFLSFINYSRDPFTSNKHLLSEINYRKIYSLFEKNFKDGERMLEASEHKDLNYYLNQFELYNRKDTYNSLLNDFSKDDIGRSEYSLLTYFILKILEIQNYILYQCRTDGIDSSLLLNENAFDAFMKRLPGEVAGLPRIQIYYNALKLERTGEEKYYSKLKILLSQYGKLLRKDELYDKYLYMIQYIKNKHSTKEWKTNLELFHLRKEIIERNLLMENTIKNMFFLNLVKSGLRIKEFDWILGFIKNYQQLLVPKFREITVTLSLALYHFEKKQYKESLNYAAQIKYEDNFYTLQTKNLTARIYYETGDFESLVSFIASYRMYLSKNRTLSGKEFQSHINFLNHLDKLLRIREQRKYYKLGVFMNDIEKIDFVNNVWLIKRAKEMLVKDSKEK